MSAEPMTDTEIEAAQQRANERHLPGVEYPYQPIVLSALDVPRLIATVRSEKARADAAEAKLARVREFRNTFVAAWWVVDEIDAALADPEVNIE